MRHVFHGFSSGLFISAERVVPERVGISAAILVDSRGLFPRDDGYAVVVPQICSGLTFPILVVLDELIVLLESDQILP